MFKKKIEEKMVLENFSDTEHQIRYKFAVWANKYSLSWAYKCVRKEGVVDIASREYKVRFWASCFFKITVKFSDYCF